MPTLYVENVPKDLYEALRDRARTRHRSIAAEIISLLEENIPTKQELRRRKALFQAMAKLRAKKPLKEGPFLSAEELLREDRDR